MTEPRRLSDHDGPSALLLASAHDDGPSTASFERTAKRLGLAGAAFGAATLATSSGAAGTSATVATVAKGAGALGAGAGVGSAGAGLASSGAGAGLVGATKAAGVAGMSLFAKIAGIAVVGVVLTAGTVVATREAPKPLPASSAAPPAAVAALPAKRSTEAPLAHATAAPEESAEPATAPAPMGEPAVEPTKATKAKGSAKATAGTEDDHALRDEVALLDQARAALASGNTAAALSALDRHKREFPRGFLSSEAEVLRVEALVKAGRTAEARAQGERLLSREPNGPQAKRVRSLLGM